MTAVRRIGAPRVLALGALVFVVFGLGLKAPFIYDDVAFIQGNADVVGPWLGWRHFFLHPNLYQEGYEPVSLLIHRLLFLIGGGPVPIPPLFRLSNLLLHWAVCVLLLGLFTELLGPGSPAFWLTVVFAVFPSHTENMAIATFKKHILVALFGLLMLHAERPWRQEEPSLKRRAACALFLALGLLSKENAAVFPAMLAAVALALAPDWKRRLRRDGWFYGVLFAIDLAFLYWRTIVVPRSGGALVGESVSTHLLTAAKCLIWYLRELFIPVRLCQEHSVAILAWGWSWPLVAVLGSLVALALFAAWLWREDRVAFAGLSMTVLWLLPFLNLIPYLNLSLVANRYLYLAPAGALLCAASLGRKRWGARAGDLRIVPLLCAALGLFYADLAMNNLSRYRDPLEVWECAADCAQDNPRAHDVLGSMYQARMRYADAERQYRWAARIGKGYYSVVSAFDLAALDCAQGKLRQALGILQGMSPRYHSMRQYPYMGYCQFKLNDYAKAETSFKKALALNPRDGLSRWGLGLCYAQRGRKRLAEIEWRTASLDPGYRSMALQSLGRLYQRQQRWDRAEGAYQEALRANPLQLKTVQALAQLYARRGDPRKGLALFDELLRLLDAGQKQAFSAAGGLSPAQLGVATDSLPAAMRARALFLAKHPDLLAKT